MSIFWSLPPTFTGNCQDPQTIALTDTIRVTAESWSMKRSESIAEFTGNVVAKYGVTTVSGDQITFLLPTGTSNLLLRKAIAKGHVSLVDPDGTITAERLEFDWETGNGTAMSAVVNIAGMELKVSQIEIKPGEWTLFDVNASLCKDDHIGFASKKLVYRPSERADFQDAQLRLYGKTVLGLKSQSFNLGPEGRTSLWPDIVLGGSKGVGVQWSGRHAISDRLKFVTKFGFATESRPWGDAFLVQSLLPAGNAVRPPKSDTSEVASRGYFENITIPDPESELSSERQARGAISIGTSWNSGRYASLQGSINKPYELILEGGGKLNQFGWFVQVRNHRLDQEASDDLSRTVSLASISLPRTPLTKAISVLGRVDARTFASGESNSGGWIRGQLGLVTNLGVSSRLGIAYSDSNSFGDPPLDFEALDSKRSYHVRGDYFGGSTKFSALFKYGPDGEGWFDHEFTVRQAAGCIEPFVTFRSRPRVITFGFSLRPLEKIERLEDSISRRQIGNNLP